MKILSVKGRNLASLEGEFSIDFESGALGRAGLFAITGPTGSGKSTILDAICVALFDKTPRLSDSGGALIGRAGDDDKLGSNDVRSLLRRGAGTGFAEVAFVGRDGRGYRARWTVRRAREAATGRFQAQTLELRDLATGQGVGGTKSETLKCIQELVGLTYEQFCRSVLLAQGDFAAFLKADEKERSALLERITGTQIYGNISKAAFRRMREEEQLLADLERRKGDIALLDDEQRKSEEEALALVGEALRGARARLAAADKAGAWYLQLKGLQEGVEGGALDEARAGDRCAAAAELRLELAAVERVQPLRSLVQQADGAGARAAEAAAAVENQVSARSAAHERRDLGRLKLAESLAAAAEAERCLAEARPLMLKAGGLDARLKDALLLAEKARLESVSAGNAALLARSDFDRMQAEDAALASQVAAASSWLEEHGSIAPLAAQWDRWHKELQRYREANAHGEKVAGLRLDLLDREERTFGESERAAVALSAAAEEERGAFAASEASEQKAAGVDGALLSAQRGTEERQRDILKALRQLNAEFDAELAEQGKTSAALQEARSGEAASRAQWQLAERDGEIAEASLGEATRALSQARAARSLDEQRGELRAGEACPLCGSEDHPWAAGSPVAGLLAGLEQRVGQLSRERSSHQKREAAGREREGHLAVQARTLEARCEELRESLGKRQSAWGGELPGVVGASLPVVAGGSAASGAVEAALAAVEEKLRSIRAREKDAQELAIAGRKLREAYDAARGGREALAKARDLAEKAHREAAEARRIADLDQASAEKELARIRDTLCEPFALRKGWEQQLQAKDAKFIAALAAEAKQWISWTGRHDDGKKARSEMETRLAAGRVRLEGAREAESGKGEELAGRERTVAELKGERREYFEGRAVEAVEAELTRRQQAALAALNLAREEDGKRESECAAAAAALEQLSESVRQLEQAAGAASAVLEEELAARGISEELLRRQLLRDHPWITAQREFLHGLDQAVHAARTVLEERRRSLAEHELTGAPALPEDRVPAEKDAAGTEAGSLEQRQFDLRHRLEVDDTARKKYAELSPLIGSQAERTDLWRGISEVIGSADGKKFRTYAQSLTLEVLLGYANEHLKSLTPRYGVLRVPSSEMELQMVDRDMGDEIRSVNSLSGGESFLVSLALALGLSSLSSHSTRVESLFIDEGFGSLDQDTLEVALATLDALQASGRKVGIISHVPGLAERIGVRIDVVPGGGGRSRVRVLG